MILMQERVFDIIAGDDIEEILLAGIKPVFDLRIIEIVNQQVRIGTVPVVDNLNVHRS